jgi:ferrochelatase
MRHWHPYLGDTLAELRRAGIDRVVVIPLAPHYSRLSIGAYERVVNGGRGDLEIALVRHWHDHPRFLDAVAERVRAALARFPDVEREAVPLRFTAHSLPRRILAEGDPYVAQLEASVAGVVERLPGDPARARLGFQSAGRSAEPWLEPEAASLLEELARSEERNVLVCPIGFVSDHLEVLYDVDVELAALARRLGMRLERSESLNTSAALVDALADLATRTAAARGWG